MGSQQETAAEMKGLFSLLLTTTGCLAAPMADYLGSEPFGYVDDNTDHRDIVELTKFVRDHLALDVKENRRFAERSNNQTEIIANAILRHVNDLNRNSTTKFEETLKKLQETIEENMGAIVDQTRENHEALEEQSRENDKHILEETSKNFNSLLSGLKGRLSQHEKMLNTHVAVCAEQYNNITIDQMRAGFQRIYDMMGDISIVVPQAYMVLERFVLRCRSAGIINDEVVRKMPS